jgi:hypothetical protein
MHGYALVSGLRSTLAGYDLDKWIHDLGQVEAYTKRRAGAPFSLIDHIRGLVLAQLSNQRRWGPIAAQMGTIDGIFGHYDPDVLLRADPATLSSERCVMKCGNRKVGQQMRGLGPNIRALQQIEREWGSLDLYVSGRDPITIARELSTSGEYKLREIGFTLAMEYLKNVGIRAAKPDVHILRLLGPERLGYLQDRNEEKAVRAIADLAAEARVNEVYMDNLLWLFCAKDYADICGAQPRCSRCALKSNCRYPSTAAERNLTF